MIRVSDVNEELRPFTQVAPKQVRGAVLGHNVMDMSAGRGDGGTGLQVGADF
jgi:hypothetical protein